MIGIVNANINLKNEAIRLLTARNPLLLNEVKVEVVQLLNIRFYVLENPKIQTVS